MMTSQEILHSLKRKDNSAMLPQILFAKSKFQELVELMEP
jgi:hypothetical protein